MIRLIAGKVALALVTLAFVLTFNFFLFRAVGDPKNDLLRVPHTTATERAHLIHARGSTAPSSTSSGSTCATRSAGSSRRATTRAGP